MISLGWDKVFLVLCGILTAFSLIYLVAKNRNAQQTNVVETPEKAIKQEHSQLLKEERLLEAKTLLIDNYRCFDGCSYREWECRVGEAHIDISNKGNLDVLFRLSVNLCLNRSATPSQRKQIRRKTYSVLMARTRFLLASRIDRAKERHTNFHCVKFQYLLELWTRWLDFLSLYSDRTSSSYTNHWKVFNALNQAICNRDVIANWKSTIDPLHVNAVHEEALKLCRDLAGKERWGEAWLQCKLCASISPNNEFKDKTLQTRIRIQASFCCVDDQRFVAETFCMAKKILIPDHGEKEELVSLLFNLFGARVDLIFPLSRPGEIIAFLQHDAKIDAPFLARLEVLFLWRILLDVCNFHCESEACSILAGQALCKHYRREKRIV